MSKIKEKIKSFLPDMKKAIERFPLTVFCSVVVFILSVYLVENPELKNENLLNELHKMVILLGMSIPLTLALELAREKYFSVKNKWVIRFVNALITLVFIIFYRFYYLSGKNSSSTLDSLEQLMATGIIFFLCFLLVPVIGKKDEEEKYFQSVIVDKTVTILFSVVLFLGLIAVFATIDGLSLIKLDSNIYIETWLFVVFVFSVIFFLSKLKKVDESLENYEIHKIFKFLIYFIVIPLITTYTGILYVYFGKMLITRSWPQGLVSHLILWYTIFSLFIMIMVTPMAKKDSVARVFKKYFPFASLPLLVLSIVSISKRISQYGVTPSRYFVVLLAMWLIFCMVSSIFKARLSVILISLITVVYISVFTPVNNRRITLMSQNKRFEKILVKHGLLKDGKLVKKPELAKEKKYEVTDVLNYILGINDRRNDIENLKPFGKTDGKPYKDREEFEKSLGIDTAWYQYSDFGSIGDSYFVTFGINENVLVSQYNGIEEVKEYDYAITNLESYFTDNNNVKEFFGKYPVKLSQEGIAVYDGKIEDNKELIKVNMPEIVDKIIKNPEIQQRVNKRKDEIKDSVVPENILEFTGENEKVKYKVKVIEISVTGEEHKAPRVSKYYYSFYYSIKNN
jgi:putative membrane protein